MTENDRPILRMQKSEEWWISGEIQPIIQPIKQNFEFPVLSSIHSWKSQVSHIQKSLYKLLEKKECSYAFCDNILHDVQWIILFHDDEIRTRFDLRCK